MQEGAAVAVRSLEDIRLQQIRDEVRKVAQSGEGITPSAFEKLKSRLGPSRSEVRRQLDQRIVEAYADFHTTAAALADLFGVSRRRVYYALSRWEKETGVTLRRRRDRRAR
jgi:uncharacterized protein YciW